jgi:peptide/nickel transport system permease protein
MWHFSLLWSDWLFFILLLLLALVSVRSRRYNHLRKAWLQVGKSRVGMITAVILAFYLGVTLLDSIHVTIPSRTPHFQSVLDVLLTPMSTHHEKTYSSPFATHLYVKTPNKTNNTARPKIHTFAPLKFILGKTGLGKNLVIGFTTTLISLIVLLSIVSWLYRLLGDPNSKIAWSSGLVTFAILILLCNVLWEFSRHYHVLGTDKIGRDVFYLTIKSIRTGVLIGTLSTLFMLPFALFLGTLAGYFRGIVDDVIQYIYITLSSIPGVLLISAAILVMDVYIHNHQWLFVNMEQRADARLLALCLILGITSWAGLCRLLRGESMKVREMDYVHAARVMGVSHWRIIRKHIFPNVMHIVMIALVLDFSGLVLAEAVLSYVGVGVDPTMISWGNMINASRLELSRQPLVWWPLVSALISMFILVISANLFADRVRDAFDPRSQR